METKIVSSREISKLVHLPYLGEPNSLHIENFEGKEAYIGNALKSQMPFFLDFNDLMNPHTFVFGASGGGKSYLLKNLILRMCMLWDPKVLLIDFTGEYSEFAELTNAYRRDLKSLAHEVLEEKSGLFYLDLSGLGENEKVESAIVTLEQIVSLMRKRKINAGYNTFIVLDEAWKVLARSKVLEILVREGRKYGVGMLMASQILSDIDEKFLANISTLFTFRLQDDASVEKLAANYGLGPESKEMIKNLDVGSCLVIQLHRNKFRSAFFIDKVVGVKNYNSVLLKSGKKMEVEIEEHKLASFLGGIGLGSDSIAQINLLLHGGERISLHKLIYELMMRGADRSKLLNGLRSLRVPEEELADAFSRAIQEVA